VTQREAGGSSYSEALGTDKGLKFLKAELESLGKRIVEIVHDNNTNVDSKIAAIVPQAKNSKDMWHNTKAHAFKEKLESIIAQYQELQTIDGELRELDTKHRGGVFQLFKNHFYWAAMKALEDGEDDAMMLAVRFVEGGLAQLIDDHSLCEDRHTGLRHSKLKKDGPAYRALLEWAREAATDSKAIFFTRCRKSARTESLHRINNKYAGKLYFYRKSYPARVALAQLDYTGHRDIYASLFGVDSARAREAGTVGREEDLGLHKPKKVRSEKKHYNFRRAILNRVFNPRGTKSASYADEVCVGER
jgi:hypothetical protein